MIIMVNAFAAQKVSYMPTELVQPRSNRLYYSLVQRSGVSFLYNVEVMTCFDLQKFEIVFSCYLLPKTFQRYITQIISQG